MSTTPTTTETVAIEFLTLSQLIWRKFKRQPAGYIERVLDLNQGISTSVYLPVGTVVILPLDLPTDFEEPEVVRLWD